MYDTFTDHAKRVMNYARSEAVSRIHEHIEPWHLLLGLLNTEDCGANDVLRRMGLTYASADKAVRGTWPDRIKAERRSGPTLSDESRDVVRAAQKSAEQRLCGTFNTVDVNPVDTIDLLLGIVERMPRLLEVVALDPKSVEAAVQRFLSVDEDKQTAPVEEPKDEPRESSGPVESCCGGTWTFGEVAIKVVHERHLWCVHRDDASAYVTTEKLSYDAAVDVFGRRVLKADTAATGIQVLALKPALPTCVEYLGVCYQD